MTRETLFIHEHTSSAISKRLSERDQHSYLRDWVYGGVDGAITTFAVVSGVVGANLSSKTIIILGVANLAADGFSMAASNYLGTRAEQEELEFWKSAEEQHIANFPQGETEEIRQILRRYGFQNEILEQAVKIFVKNKKAWIRLMLSEEYDLPKSIRNPWTAALSTLSAFLICGIVPLFPYFGSVENSFVISCLSTGLVFFAIGSIKSRWAVTSWLKSGLKTFFVGATAALISYAVGYFLGALQ